MPTKTRKLLATYEAKRSFDRTPEPSGREPEGAPSRAKAKANAKANAKAKPPAKRAKSAETAPKVWRFVVQKHNASHLHYDFRLEADGVLKSWAVPKGPSLDPKERRLAMQVEDHPIGYFDFEGVIPAGNYGAGEVIVWDWGSYTLVEGEDPASEIAQGKLKFVMAGEKLKGMFTLVQMHGKGGLHDRGWLLIKDHDAYSKTGKDVTKLESSVKSGKTLTEIAQDPKAPHWQSNRPAKGATGTKDQAPAAKAKARVAKAAHEAAPTKIAKVAKAAKTSTASKTAVTHGAKMPKVTTPMLATLADRPFDDDGWLFETKWDGFRAICTIHEDGKIELVSRNGLDLLPKFSALASMADGLTERPLILDGEIVVLDEHGRSSFQGLQNVERATPHYVAFDILYGDGRDLRKLPLEERKELLEARVRSGQKQVIYSRHVVGAGTKLFALAERERLEGIMAKKKDSLYVEKRSREWLKIKVQNEQEMVIVGYTEPRGARADLGALLLGVYEPGAKGKNGKLVYAGHVGTGFSQKTLATLRKKLEPLKTDKSPFAQKIPKNAPTHWVKPELVCQVKFAEWTSDGILRQPSFLGMREDKDAKDVHRELPKTVRE